MLALNSLEYWGNLVKLGEFSSGWEVVEMRRCRLEEEILREAGESCNGTVVVEI